MFISFKPLFQFTRWLRQAARMLVLCSATFSHGAGAALPDVDIATEPLFDMRTPPNVLVSLSIDTNSLGPAYPSRYNKNVVYQGYFNPAHCYTYSGTPNFHFVIAEAANSDRECGGKFSGSFMNWASMTTLDLVRYGLTGGDRDVDTLTDTVVRRAYLPLLSTAGFAVREIAATVSVKVTPFSTAIKLISCHDRLIIADSTADTAESVTKCTAPTKTIANKPLAAGLAAAYVTRVKVCDSANGATRPDLCRKYGNNYKPIGSLQRHAEKMRFGVMAYLPGTDTNLYGGVLRSPMKFIGPKRYAIGGKGNPEWDDATGILYKNPDDPDKNNWGSKTADSGMINFINQFGRNGWYKHFYDPLSELYYEGIRYFQGKQPSAEATQVPGSSPPKSISDDVKEGFPVITDWQDPVIASCQRNQIVVIADAFTNYDFYVPGNPKLNLLDPARGQDVAVDKKTPELDAVAWTKKLGAMEADAGKNPSPDSSLAGLDTMITGYLKYGSYYFSGLAYWANTNDIRLDKPVRVKTFVIDIDEGGDGQIGNATRQPSSPRTSQLYLAAKYGGFEDVSGEANPFISMNTAGTAMESKTSKQWDANGDGIPDNYFLASQPNKMVEALQKIAPLIPPYSGSTIAAPAVLTPRVVPGHSFLFQAGYRTPSWSGTLRKLKLSATDASSPLQVASGHEWEAGAILTGVSGTAANPTPANRSIYTYNAKFASGSTIEFKWSNLTDSQKTSLNGADANGEKRLGFLRGERSNELGQTDGTMRTRDSILGDIVNSNVKLVGAPALNIQSTTYNTFYEANKSRSPTLYVGANDGMLHAFDTTTGEERFAYVPSMLIPDLGLLTYPDYVHRPYVDGQIAVAEAEVDKVWKTVLASGLGKGGRAIFALDVTNPSKFAAGAGVLLEFSNSDDAEFGVQMGAPVIAKFRTGTTKGVAEYKYFVVAPSGLNVPGALFLISLDKKTSTQTRQEAIKVPISTENVGIGRPALVLGADGAVRYAYAGDLQGNLWRIDFTSALTSATLSKAVVKSIFTASIEDSKKVLVAQPITTQPSVIYAADGGYVILFGTGKFYETSDLDSKNFSTQSFYGIYDAPSDTQLKRADLPRRVVSGTDRYTISSTTFSTTAATPASPKSWYFDLPDSDDKGERQVTNGLVLDGQLYFNTLSPGTDPCKPGSGRAYSVSALSGTSDEQTGSSTSIGFLSAPVLLQMGDVKPGTRSVVGRRNYSKTVRVLHVGTGGSGTNAANTTAASGAAKDTKVPAGRFSWREILNWDELRTEAMKSK